MDLVVLVIILVVAAVVLLAGGALFLLRGRGGDEAVGRPPRRAPEPEPPQPEGTDVAGPTDVVSQAEAPPEPAISPEPEPARPPSFFERLGKARGTISSYLGSVLSRSGITAETWDELEEALILADVGVPTTMSVMEELRERATAERIDDPGALLEVLKEILKARVGSGDGTLHMDGSPAIWLFVGVNGVGKTTTIGKLARREHDEGRAVVLAAGDTFRAAAVDQLAMWAERADAEIIRGAEGADPSSVVFDAIEHAGARGADLVMADTAGRLHTKTNLMEELRKVRRVAEKGAESSGGAVSEVLLVIDATTGQNGLVQARQFTDAVEVTGVVLTKLDGSAKGGIVMAIREELDIPVKLVGLGEGIGDLVAFDADEFVEALFESGTVEEEEMAGG